MSALFVFGWLFVVLQLWDSPFYCEDPLEQIRSHPIVVHSSRVRTKRQLPTALDIISSTNGSLDLAQPLENLVSNISDTNPDGIRECFDAALNGEQILIFDRNANASDIVWDYFVSLL